MHYERCTAVLSLPLFRETPNYVLKGGPYEKIF
jgi:hypothetical protein